MGLFDNPRNTARCMQAMMVFLFVDLVFVCYAMIFLDYGIEFSAVVAGNAVAILYLRKMYKDIMKIDAEYEFVKTKEITELDLKLYDYSFVLYKQFTILFAILGIFWLPVQFVGLAFFFMAGGTYCLNFIFGSEDHLSRSGSRAFAYILFIPFIIMVVVVALTNDYFVIGYLLVYNFMLTCFFRTKKLWSYLDMRQNKNINRDDGW